MKETAKKYAAGLLVLTLLSMPLIMYCFRFGFTLSADHQRWAQFGTYFAGIYSPMVAVLALSVLYRQARLMLIQSEFQSKQTDTQLRQANIEAQISRLQHERTVLHDCRVEFLFYINTVKEELSRMANEGRPFDSKVSEVFRSFSLDKLKEPEYQETVYELHNKNERLLTAWAGVYVILPLLRDNKEEVYNAYYARYEVHTITALTFPICVALDKCYCVWSEDKRKGDYIFWGR